MTNNTSEQLASINSRVDSLSKYTAIGLTCLSFCCLTTFGFLSRYEGTNFQDTMLSTMLIAMGVIEIAKTYCISEVKNFQLKKTFEVVTISQALEYAFIGIYSIISENLFNKVIVVPES